MMPAAKMMDPVMGIDIHIIQPPGPVPPLPIPHPFVGMLFDPMELAPIVGASVFVNGMPKATAGSEGKALPPHIPIGGMFVPPPPGNECEMFMGSATVLFEGEPASYLALPALSCQSVGMPSPPRAKKKPKPILKLPTSVVMPIPAGPPVLIGGPPTISMTVIGMKVAMGVLGKAAGKLRKMMKASDRMAVLSAKLKMKAAKAMDALGVPSTSSIRNKVDNAICTVTGHPVDVATGRVFTDHVDLSLPGPIPLRWKRVYSSTSTYSGPLGHGWHHSYDLALAVERDAVAIRLGDGRIAAFPILEVGASFYLRSEKATLVRDDQGYALVTRGKLSYRFSQRPDPKGVFPLLEISEPAGNRIRFGYDAQGHLEAIHDGSGRLIRIHTDWDGRILSIHVPHPRSDGQFLPIISFRYDEKGDLVEATDPAGNSWRFAYREHLLVKETNRNGLSFHFLYDSTGPSARCVRTWGDGGIYDHKLIYDEAGKTTLVEDSLGNKTVYHVADSGLVTRVINPKGGSRVSEYNAFNELTATIDELGQETRFEYDERGNCACVQGPDGRKATLRYADDNPVYAMDAAGGEWRWEYDRFHRQSRRIDPMGEATEYRYEGSRLASVVDATGREIRFDYGSSGELRSMRLPGGQESRWEYDRLGRCILAVDAKGNPQRRTYDFLNRLIRLDEPDGTSRDLEYDPEGNPVRVSDSRQDVKLRYRGLNRLSSRFENGTEVAFEYDTEERLIGILNENGSAYRYELDGLGLVSKESRFDESVRIFERDSKGRVTKVYRPGGLSTSYRYDAANRVIAVEHSDGEKEEYAYRPDGKLISAQNSATKVRFERDAVGRVIKETQGSHSIESRYDRLGRRLEARSSMGAMQRIERDHLGKPVRIAFGTVENPDAWEAVITRDSMGLELERTLPGGIRARWARDTVGRPVKHNIITGTSFRSREYTWEQGEMLGTVRDSRHGITHFERDPVGNLIRSTEVDGSFVLRIPDALGNLFKSADRDDRVYGKAGQLLEARNADGITRYEYDPEGNLVRKMEPNGKAWTYHWNGSGMLVKVIRPDGSEVEFAYDALGRRIRKQYRGVATYWLWDGPNPLHEWVEGDTKTPQAAPQGSEAMRSAAHDRLKARLAGTPASGPPSGDKGTSKSPISWLFEPDGFTPLAKVVGNQAYSILPDHTGLPLAMFDATGRETWSAQIDIYGIPRRLEGDRAACPFRFPGQYEDQETGLCYNRYRYYCPEIGKYISPDPIGILHGTNLYNYVMDPTRFADPFGLAPLFRGTSEGYPGNPSLQRIGVTPTSTDPRVATIFGTESSNHGKGIVQIAEDADLEGVNQIEGNCLKDIEREVGVEVKPSEFGDLASTTIPVEDARRILNDMGLDVPDRVHDKSGISQALDGLEPMTPEQTEEFIRRAKAMCK